MTLFHIDLQLFTGEKTEKATPKRKKEAREKGQVMQSKEINSALILLFTFLALFLLGNYTYQNLLLFTHNMFLNTVNTEDLFTVNGIHKMFMLLVTVTAKLVVPIMGVAFLVGLICSYMQVGFLFTTKTLGIKFDRINPINGFKKIFSKKSLVEFVKSLLKIILVGYVTFSYALKQSKTVMNILDMSLESIIGFIGSITIQVAFRAAIVLILLAVMDYFFQKWEYENELKMSKQEVKEEYKQMEGDPQVKSKIKEKQRQISMRRMMQDVPKADVIITNPTHYAVALRYDSNLEAAPVLLAKGVDLVAQNIKKAANEHEIPIVENKLLARTIFYQVDIGASIPPDLYQAVAEVLAYVYQLKNSY
ncbi:flagellar biosynthetic protein FlhB [Geosporobacter subterraneus DSM 17957]|uniref:Flagellar biosynthetic protein FlhB n=1 Tax=Geosporobacter subterraneus DSM 17957 TaxID=1121919 RepID=A0A1M6E3E8_9FIRM|nr:flagellar biosynthesis protein FlhB [Geosporobacter subterraneus]SHI79900.1 flagellar biosynthetic protein FlhB [Geosporobacter subterraneus DSM 17957]